MLIQYSSFAKMLIIRQVFSGHYQRQSQVIAGTFSKALHMPGAFCSIPPLIFPCFTVFDARGAEIRKGVKYASL